MSDWDEVKRIKKLKEKENWREPEPDREETAGCSVNLVYLLMLIVVALFFAFNSGDDTETVNVYVENQVVQESRKAVIGGIIGEYKGDELKLENWLATTTCTAQPITSLKQCTVQFETGEVYDISSQFMINNEWAMFDKTGRWYGLEQCGSFWNDGWLSQTAVNENGLTPWMQECSDFWDGCAGMGDPACADRLWSNFSKRYE